jgi:hypothetical protein
MLGLTRPAEPNAPVSEASSLIEAYRDRAGRLKNGPSSRLQLRRVPPVRQLAPDSEACRRPRLTYVSPYANAAAKDNGFDQIVTLLTRKWFLGETVHVI